MVVCVDDDASADDDIIGFVEIGMLPRPATVNDITKKVKEDMVVSSLDDRAEVTNDISKAIAEAMVGEVVRVESEARWAGILARRELHLYSCG